MAEYLEPMRERRLRQKQLTQQSVVDVRRGGTFNGDSCTYLENIKVTFFRRRERQGGRLPPGSMFAAADTSGRLVCVTPRSCRARHVSSSTAAGHRSASYTHLLWGRHRYEDFVSNETKKTLLLEEPRDLLRALLE